MYAAINRTTEVYHAPESLAQPFLPPSAGLDAAARPRAEDGSRSARVRRSTALASVIRDAPPVLARGRSILARIAACTILGAALSGCRPSHAHSQGVELVTSTDTPTPAMTFELRFEPAMVREGDVGPAATNPPMVITPPLAGT